MNENKTLNEVVKSVLADLEKRVQSKVIEPSNYALLKKLIEKADTADEAIKIAELGTTYKRTGFHFDKRLEKTSDTISYFKRNKDLSFTQNPADITHKLIIGDNYPALLNLLIQYRRKVDVIYIDPPYGKDSMGAYAQTNYENNITRDNLLSMLYPRLVLAKQLLSDNGVIFCSIDDRNQAYVKGLFDEVFGEKNFIATNIIENNRGGRDYGGIAVQHEYLLMYAKNQLYCEPNLIEEENKIFDYKDEEGGFNLQELRNRNKKFNKENRPNLFYPFYVNPKKKYDNNLLEISLEPKEGFEEVFPAKSEGIQTVWRWGKEEKARQNLNKVIFGKINKNNGFMIVQKYRKTCKMQRSIWEEKLFVNERGTEEVKSIFQVPCFDYPKSKYLIRRVLELGTSASSIILDFFAGSGTTGQAVLELNKQDGGNRQFICVQLNEDLDKALLEDPKNQTIKNQIALCEKYHRPHELSEITAERLRRVMTGKCYDDSTDFAWNKKNAPLGGNLDVYNLENVSNFETTPHKTAFEVIDESLYGQKRFSTLQEKVEWVCSNFEHTQKQLEAK